LSVSPEGKRETRWYTGRIPGVIEEAFVSIKTGQPLYVIGAFGGAAALVADLLEGRHCDEFTWEHQMAAPHSAEMRALYAEQGPPWEDYDEMAGIFASVGVPGLAARNSLSADQNRELFRCRDVGRIVELLLEGLTRLPT
jgi:hypothetical protein